MSDHHCGHLIATCIDFRFQEYINQWIQENLPVKSYDRVALAGGVFNLETILKQVEVSKRLHSIKKVILVNHEDCGAYGEQGSEERHAQDLKNAQEQIKTQFPDIQTESYYLHLDGTFEKI